MVTAIARKVAVCRVTRTASTLAYSTGFGSEFASRCSDDCTIWLLNTCLPTANPSPASLAVAACDRLAVVVSISHVWNLLCTEDVHLHTLALRIGTHFLVALETVFLFHILSTASGPFSSLSARLAHAARLGFFFTKNALYKIHCYYSVKGAGCQMSQPSGRRDSYASLIGLIHRRLKSTGTMCLIPRIGWTPQVCEITPHGDIPPWYHLLKKIWKRHWPVLLTIINPWDGVARSDPRSKEFLETGTIRRGGNVPRGISRG